MAIVLNSYHHLILAHRRAFFAAQDTMWSAHETHRLDLAVCRFGTNSWDAVASSVGNKTAAECQARYDRLVWTDDEDDELQHLVGVWEETRGHRLHTDIYDDNDEDNSNIWRLISLRFEHKDPSQCLARWNFIGWSAREDLVLRQAVATVGRNQWWHVAFWLKTKAAWQCKERWTELNGTTSSEKA